MEKLNKLANFKGRSGALTLVIMDGVGYGKYTEGDAVANANIPTLKGFMANYPTTKLKAHGVAVGLPSDDDMGNSEVGHNALGAGRVFDQGAKLIDKSLATGSLYTGDTWKKLVSSSKNSTLHFIGLLSDGGVHSNIEHLRQLVKQAKKDGVKTVRVHALLDGRDVGATSALEFFTPFEDLLKELSTDGFDARIASGGGRMKMTMDRYNADWAMVEYGWNCHVKGEGRQFSSATEAIKTYRMEIEGLNDQDMDSFIVADNGKPIGKIVDGDAVVLFNFRGDRALEISRAFDEDNFSEFNRGAKPNVFYAGMMEYDGDLHIPSQYLVTPPTIDRTFPEYLCNEGVKQLSISETQKFGHVTYFFNGNKSAKFSESLETYIEIKSDNGNFDKNPAMKCHEITDKVVDAINSNEFKFIKLNFPNGDMVGHTGNYDAVIKSMEAMDECLAKIYEATKKAGGIMVLTADHGNADDMYEHKKDGATSKDATGKPVAKTSHSLNLVPFIVVDTAYADDYSKELKEGLGISSVAATVLNLLGYKAPADYDETVLK